MEVQCVIIDERLYLEIAKRVCNFLLKNNFMFSIITSLIIIGLCGILHTTLCDKVCQ